jgi:putative transcriptional regulator
MTPNHHPGEATLLAYAAGGLGEGLSLVVASHLSFCPECRANVAAGEAVGGSLLDELAPAELDRGARDRMLALIDKAVPSPAPALPRRAPADPLVPAPLAAYLGGGLSAIEWRILAPGLRQSELLPHDLMGGANLRMLRIAPGKKMPRHGHTGTELTLVLRGAYTDELGRFGRGDVAETDDDIVHEPLSERAEDCICLIATEGPLKFDSLIARTVQRFTGF